MKTLLSLLLLLLSFGRVFAEDAELPDLMSYERYQENVQKYCKLEGNIPNKSSLWQDWKSDSLIKIEEVNYADITKKNSDEAYKDYLKKIQADTMRLTTIGLSTGPVFLEKASYVYKETMGAIYACAVMNAKVRITDNLLTKIPTKQSNLKERLTKQLSYTRKTMEQKGCREVKDTSELSLKKSLLDNTTYQYCNYRQYLYYLDNASKKSIGAYYNPQQGSTANAPNLIGNTDIAAQEIAHSANKIRAEISHTKEVYPQAMVAFTEFERTYASHVLLEFILQDYIELRDSLKQLLNPIGQVVYKASNAQSPGK